MVVRLVEMDMQCNKKQLEVENQKKHLIDELRWNALLKRDPSVEKQFVYSVFTTGIYCRPTCPSKLALRKNISFYNTCEEAEKLGFRPCKRCRPNGLSLDEKNTEIAIKACRIIELEETFPTSEYLAESVGVSLYHFQRIFKKIIGITPKQYAISYRENKVKLELKGNSSVTNAIYNAGYNSNSRFYEKSTNMLGMKPKEFQSGAKGMQINYTIVSCKFGFLLIAVTYRGICSVLFGDTSDFIEKELYKLFPNAMLKKMKNNSSHEWVNAILNHIEHPNEKLHLPLDIQGTSFQKRVWNALCEIPAGKTKSYTDIALLLGQPKAVHAVANACAQNPIAFLIPCHRVVRANGDLSGYRWGVERKRKLLEDEGAF